jgi:RNA 2',3'-cyclic 3'-phosphodiesterase
MRIFIAIGIPEKIKNKLIKIQEEFKDEVDMIRTKEFHLTIKFLDDISPLKLQRVKARLEGMMFKDFELQLTRIGIFPNEQFVKVLWVGVKPESKVNQLQDRISEKLRDMFGIDKRFKAHITIGRIKSVSDKETFMEKVRELDVEGDFRVKHFELIKSTLSSEESPEYETLEVY